MTKLLSATALSVMLACGAAYAQEGGESGSRNAPEQNMQQNMQGANADIEGIGGFFTDDTMTEVRSEEENRETFMAMPAEDQQMMRDNCGPQSAVEGVEDGSDTAAMAGLCDQVRTWEAR